MRVWDDLSYTLSRLSAVEISEHLFVNEFHNVYQVVTDIWTSVLSLLYSKRCIFASGKHFEGWYVDSITVAIVM
jgi:hypothetical protein